jgi:hypothetical protein
MKPIMSIIARSLGIGITQSNANMLDIHLQNQKASFSATYPAMQDFRRVVGEKSYIGFRSESSACSVWILSNLLVNLRRKKPRNNN